MEKNGKATSNGHAHDIVMLLMDELLFEGRTLYTDSFCTSVPLAEEVLGKVATTCICGTVKVNKKILPMEAKLKQKRGDFVALENS